MIENSNVLVVLFLMLYLVFTNYLLKKIEENHFGLKALIIFIFATLTAQLAKTIPNYPNTAYYILLYSMLTIDIGNIFLFLKIIFFS